MTHTIYALQDPRDPKGQYRYVGSTTKTVSGRIKHHLSQSKRQKNKRAKWLSQLRELGVSPTYEILDQFDNKESAHSAETYWIVKLKGSGHPLVNMRKGGGGNTPESAKKMYKKVIKFLESAQELFKY